MGKPNVARPIHDGNVVEVFKSKIDKQWRWRVVASNGQIIASSGEGYHKRSHALEMADALWPESEDAVPSEGASEPLDDASVVIGGDKTAAIFDGGELHS